MACRAYTLTTTRPSVALPARKAAVPRALPGDDTLAMRHETLAHKVGEDREQVETHVHELVA
jgi:hypothetical protein